MKRVDWRDNTPRSEQNYYSDILRILEEFFLGDNGILTSPTQNITKSEALEMYARQAAERMVVGRLQANARTWRQAARSSMRSGEIFTSLRRELAGPVGDRARELVLRNSRLITTFPHEVAALVAARAAAHYAGGGRSLTLAQSDKLLSRATRVRARLIARTEVSKASTALTQARAEDLGLVWYVWQTSEDSRVRFSHRRMDRVLCRWSDPPNPESLARERSSLGHYNSGNAPNCFTGDTTVASPSGIKKLWRAPYSGDIVTIEVERGISFSVTPNHPILTENGWIAAGLLNVGDNLVKSRAFQDSTVYPHVNNGESTFEDVFKSATLGGYRSSDFGLNFHGDVIDDYIDVVAVNRNLDGDLHPGISEGLRYFQFSDSNSGMRYPVTSIALHIGESGFSGGGNELLAFFRRMFSHSDKHSIGAVSGNDVFSKETSTNGSPIDTEEIGDPLFAPSFVDVESAQFGRRDVMTESPSRRALAEVGGFKSIGQTMIRASKSLGDSFKSLPARDQFSRVIEKRHREFSGHVYTLESGSGWYAVTSSAIIAQNCRCFPAPLLRLDQVQWPSRVYMDGAVRPMTLAAFRKLNRLSRHEERLGTQEFAA